MRMQLNRTFATSSKKLPKRLSHAGIETTIFCAGMWSVNPCIELSCSLPKATTRVWLPQLYLPNMTGSGDINGLKKFEASTLHTLVEKHGVL